MVHPIMRVSHGVCLSVSVREREKQRDIYTYTQNTKRHREEQGRVTPEPL